MAGDLLKMKKRLKISVRLSLKMLRGAYMNRQERVTQRREGGREGGREERERGLNEASFSWCNDEL